MSITKTLTFIIQIVDRYVTTLPLDLILDEWLDTLHPINVQEF